MRFVSDTRALFVALRPAGPRLNTALAMVLVMQSAIPVATALATALFVQRLDGPLDRGFLSVAFVPLLVFGLVLLVGHTAEAVTSPLEFLARVRIDGAHRTRIAVMTSATTTVDRLEDPDVQALVRESMLDAEHGPGSTAGDGAVAQLRWYAELTGVVASCFVLGWYAWWLVPLVIAPAAVNVVVRERQGFAIAGAWRQAMKEELHADVWRQATVSPSEAKDVRLFGFGDWMVHRMQAHIESGNRPLWTYLVRVVRAEWIRFAVVLAGLAPAYVIVTHGVLHAHGTVALQTAVLTAGWSVFQVLGSGEEWYRMTSARSVLAAADQLEAELATGLPREPTEQLSTTVPVPPAGALPLLRFSQVSFRYPGTGRTILDRLELEIRPGELLAIVGMNGAGKSTLIKLLAGLYHPTEGLITSDGIEMRAMSPAQWRSQMSVVFQDFIRYELSVTDNIALGRGGESPDPVLLRAAACEAGFDSVVERLPHGWDTLLSRSRTGGVDLSGGQWQQLVLARALYAVQTGAKVLVLDEPTAHLDVRTEFDVFHRLAAHRGRASLVLISHRLSTVRHADRIVLLDGGRITESGTHSELIRLGGSYAEMFAIQAERFAAGYDDSLQEGVPE